MWTAKDTPGGGWREKDLNMIFSHWRKLPKELAEKKIKLEDEPAKTAKKYKRALNIHLDYWHQICTE